MKKIFIAMFILLCFYKIKAQTNVYHPFPLVSATWRFDYSDSNCMGYCYTNNDIMNGDTTINLIIYKRFGMNQGAIRQDIPAKRVYYYDYNYDTEYLLYDFNISVGDTIPHTWYGNLDTSKVVAVQSIDSIFVAGQWRNKYTLINYQEYFYQIEIIEGIGNTDGIISPFTQCICGYDFVCFKGDGVLQLSCFSPYSNCDNLLGTNEYVKEEYVSVSPNPTSGQFTIGLQTKNADIYITDLLGQQIIKTRVTQNRTNFQLDNNGVYLICVKTERGTTTRKLIVNR